jgi:acyl-CoA dehydrogenase
MDFQASERSQTLGRQLQDFIDAHVLPRHAQWLQETRQAPPPASFMPDLKALAREEGLWNLFLPAESGLSNLDYAPLAEIMGRLPWASEVFNCNAPDTGNMELLHLFGSSAQQQQWLHPLLAGEIRSAFAMTEPDVASSDARNIQTLIRREGDQYVVNGRKWFITNGNHPDCKVMIVMGKTDPDADAHRQQSMLLVPMDSEGVSVVRNISVLNHHSPEGHAEIVLSNVRVPCSNLLGEEGGGFAMAQARLGPGRVHHCMRAIGMAELALELMRERAQERQTFGRYLSQHANVGDAIAESRIDIEQARLLVLKTAWLLDHVGARGARREIAMIKVVVPRMLCRVADRAIQVFGAMGLSPDTPLADLYTTGRTLRLADGPDEVHLRSVARAELRIGSEQRGSSAAWLTPPT